MILRMSAPLTADLLIVGGGINGVGIARDAAGRGLTVVLAEQHDLGSATSSASSKLIHGGLRYLEQFAFRLVSESLAERELLLRAAPHLVHPMRFIMPHAPNLRPAWMIRTGLFLYDRLARRQTLAASSALDLRQPPYAGTLLPQHTAGYAYSDCWVDDARLVIANARAAAENGAHILPRYRCVAAARAGLGWTARLAGQHGDIEVHARALVNAAGPWVSRFLADAVGEHSPARLKLVQGSHIVVPRLYEGAHAHILQHVDGRVVFVYPYEGRHTLIGTTDVEMSGSGDPGACTASPAEIEYLCAAANRYFSRRIDAADVMWTFCGVRPLLDDGADSPSKLTRDYVLKVEGRTDQAPLLSVFGGKITTYRKLAERALHELSPWFPRLPGNWTAGSPLPGGDLGGAGPLAYAQALAQRIPEVPAGTVDALVRRHGSLATALLSHIRGVDDLGEHFGGDLYAREVDYLIAHEWAQTADDVLWRRTKAGLHLTATQQAKLASYIAAADAMRQSSACR
jgi:glycerol-3-phosphate dehydrogenase